jgi:heat shock protein HslJ
MIRLVLILPLALAACSTDKVGLPPTQTDVRPIIAKDDLRGRWTITSVNGRQGNGLWLELGGEGPGTVTKTENGLLVGSPLPRTRAYLGCNDFRPNGWTRNGDKLTLGIEMSFMTERGCDPATMALEGEAHAILRKTMTMEFTPPNRLRLVNENGTLELVRNGS